MNAPLETKPTAKSAHLPFLDYLRGLAILLVFLFHSVGATFGATDQLVWKGWYRDFHVPHSFLILLPFTLGRTGVLLFFVISGFCIHLSHARSRDKNLKVFFIRRFFRIYPPFLVACLIFAACRLDFRTAFWPSLTDLMTHLVLLNNFLPGPGGINGSFWSIATEAQLYLLYPLLLVISTRWGWRKTMWLTGLVWALLTAVQHGASLVYPGYILPQGYLRSPFMSWYTWTIGAALADAYLNNEPLPFRRIPYSFWLGLGLLGYFFGPLEFLANTAFALAAASFIALCLDRPQRVASSRFSLLLRPLGTLGLVSYSAYLLHQPMMKMTLIVVTKVLHHHLPHLVVFMMAVSTMAIIFPVAYLFYRFIELPSIELGKWVIQKSREINPVETVAVLPVTSQE